MADCIIAGQTDSVYGFGTLRIDNPELKLRNFGGGITAWKGFNLTATGEKGIYDDNKFGYYISNLRIIASNNTIYNYEKGEFYLGRNWNNDHKSIIISSYMDHSVKGQGYKK